VSLGLVIAFSVIDGIVARERVQQKFCHCCLQLVLFVAWQIRYSLDCR
jgi:hypothetical protein